MHLTTAWSPSWCLQIACFVFKRTDPKIYMMYCNVRQGKPANPHIQQAGTIKCLAIFFSFQFCSHNWLLGYFVWDKICVYLHFILSNTEFLESQIAIVVSSPKYVIQLLSGIYIQYTIISVVCVNQRCFLLPTAGGDIDHCFLFSNRLVPTSKYYPLRMHCCRALTLLSSSTNTYVPVLPFLVEVKFHSVSSNQRGQGINVDLTGSNAVCADVKFLAV